MTKQGFAKPKFHFSQKWLQATTGKAFPPGPEALNWWCLRKDLCALLLKEVHRYPAKSKRRNHASISKLMHEPFSLHCCVRESMTSGLEEHANMTKSWV